MKDGDKVFVRAVSLSGMFAILENDYTVPITGLYDGDGDDTDDVEQAYTAVAGPLDPETDQGYFVIPLFAVPDLKGMQH
jgi:hypothetical protein